MKKVKIKSQISGKSIDELFDYQTPDKINQYFTVDNNRTFYKNNNYLDSKQLDPNETFNPLLLKNEFLFSIEKIQNNNDQNYFFVSKSNFPSLKLSYHNYRLNSNIKERESPTWISLYNFNNEINEINEKNNFEQRRKKNRNFFLKNKNNSYELNVGDVIKLGRVSLILTRIHLQKNKKNNNDSGNNLNKKANNKKNNESDNDKIVKDIYSEFHLKVLFNKINIDKDILKKIKTNNSNEQTINNNSNNNENNSINGTSFLLNEENKKSKKYNNKYLSDKTLKNNQQHMNEEIMTSKINKKLNNTYSSIKRNSKLSFNDSQSNKENNSAHYESKSFSDKISICRICYSDEEEIKSPLLNLCKCSGDVKYIHLSCLSHWLETKSKILNLSNNICKQLFFNKIHCEICKEKYPEIIFDLIKRKTYQVYKPEEIFSSLNNIYNNYIVFESFELINQKKLIYIISFDEKNAISIGRGQDCDVRLGDVTVSRMHSLFVRTKDNKIIIKDAGSKFGTLILLQAKKVLISNKILSIQIGKLYLNLCVQYFKLNCFCKIICCICCCFCLNKNKNQNKKNDIKLDKKSTNNFSYNNKIKTDILNESNYNMISINNYLFTNDNNILDYNLFNMTNITIEDVMDVKFQIDENNIKYNNNKISLFFNKYSNDNKENKKNISMIESFNNLNNVS